MTPLDPTPPANNDFSRRTFLGVLGATGVAALAAGCNISDPSSIAAERSPVIPTTKNQFNFNTQFSGLWCQSFPNCFAGVYVYLEKICSKYPKKCCHHENMCFGCACVRDPDMQSVYFVLFDTMCGRSALHLRLDGKPTEMSALIGDGDGTGGWKGKCGTDYTVDFLFGLAGYKYQKIIDANLFKNAITASIDAGRPAIAELSSDGGTFRVITGYDADTLVSSFYQTDQSKNTQEKQTKTLSYDEIKTLYIVGDKTTPRYTLKDALERIKRVFENNISEKIWDDGIAEINKMIVNPTDDEFGKINPDDFKAFRKRVAKTITNQFNSHTFDMAFYHVTKIYDKDRYPELLDLWRKLDDHQTRLGKYAHAAGRFNSINVSDIGRAGFGKMIISEFEDIKRIHLEMLDIVKQIIFILEKEAGGRGK